LRPGRGYRGNKTDENEADVPDQPTDMDIEMKRRHLIPPKKWLVIVG
jgi:hypothetical protein